MEDKLLVNFTDFFVYLLPGLIIVLATTACFKPDRLQHSQDKLGFGELFIGLAAAYLIGILMFRISEFVIYLMPFYYSENPLVGMIRKFPELDKLRESVIELLGLQSSGDIAIYRYVRIIVQEKAPASAEMAERMMAIGHLFRNLLLCIPVALLIVWKLIKEKFGLIWLVFIMVATIPLEYIILKTFLAFWSASVWNYLRAYIVLQSLS